MRTGRAVRLVDAVQKALTTGPVSQDMLLTAVRQAGLARVDVGLLWETCTSHGIADLVDGQWVPRDWAPAQAPSTNAAPRRTGADVPGGIGGEGLTEERAARRAALKRGYVATRRRGEAGSQPLSARSTIARAALKYWLRPSSPIVLMPRASLRCVAARSLTPASAATGASTSSSRLLSWYSLSTNLARLAVTGTDTPVWSV